MDCAAQYQNRKTSRTNEATKQTLAFLRSGTSSPLHMEKGPCDGVGGTEKRIVACAILQRPYDNQILTTKQLLAFECMEIQNVSFQFSDIKKHEQEADP